MRWIILVFLMLSLNAFSQFNLSVEPGSLYIRTHDLKRKLGPDGLMPDITKWGFVLIPMGVDTNFCDVRAVSSGYKISCFSERIDPSGMMLPVGESREVFVVQERLRKKLSKCWLARVDTTVVIVEGEKGANFVATDVLCEAKKKQPKDDETDSSRTPFSGSSGQKRV